MGDDNFVDDDGKDSGPQLHVVNLIIMAIIMMITQIWLMTTLLMVMIP